MTDVGRPVPGGPTAARSMRLGGREGERKAVLIARSGRWVPVGMLVLAASLLVAVPLLSLLESALEPGLAALTEAISTTVPAMAGTVVTSIGATVLALGIGATLAVLTERTEVPGRRGLRLAMLVAFIVPGYVAAMGWLNAYGPGGLSDDLVGLAAPALVGPLGIILVMGVEAAPVAYLVVVAGLASTAEPDTERAARVSGAGPLTAFRTVTLPLLGPVLAGAGAIAFVLSVTSFGVPAVLGIPAGFTTMTTRIYRDLAFSSDPDSFVRAMGLAIVLAVAAVSVIALADALLERRRPERSGVFAGPLGRPFGSSMAPVVGGVGRRRSRSLAIAFVAWAIVVGIVFVPLIALGLTALSRAPGLAPVPANWTLDQFAEVLGPRTLEAFVNSALLSAAAAVGVMLLAGLTVLARPGRGAGLGGHLLGLTFALPGSTLAVAVLLAYGVALRDTLLIILVAYLAKFWVLGHRPVAAGLAGMPADVDRAARVSGAGAWTTAVTVTLPLLRPMIVAGGLIVFMFGLHEVTMSSLLYGPGSATLAVVVLNLQQLGDANLTAALATVLTLIVAVAALPLLGRTRLLARVGWRR